MGNIDTYQQYYEQAAVWQRHNPSELEWSRVLETIKMIPEEVKSIIDLGCGDGLLTNQLLDQYEKVLGVDVSNEALKHVKAEKLVAGMDLLPLPDQSFDLAICAEVIEHLPNPIYKKSLLELQRVAQKYILITVPNDEFLRDRFIKCPFCSCTYHRYRHLHSFKLEELINLLPHFEYVNHRYLGGLTVRPYRWDTIFRQNLGNHWNVSDNCVCPQCGYTGSGSLRRGLISYFLSILRKLLPQKSKPHWVAVLYRRKAS
ncbi:MAG: class I SAM-dependent methyltransferase [Desulfotomaculaceae bacterium]